MFVSKKGKFQNVPKITSIVKINWNESKTMQFLGRTAAYLQHLIKIHLLLISLSKCIALIPY